MIISVAAVSNSVLDLLMASSFKFLVAVCHDLKAGWSGAARDESLNTSCRRETEYHTISLAGTRNGDRATNQEASSDQQFRLIDHAVDHLWAGTENQNSTDYFRVNCQSVSSLYRREA
jgi:hypothetical protein